MHPALVVLLAYVAGSFPSAYLAGRLLKGIDLRTVGSGNLGATNVQRTLGWPAAIVVLSVDLAKGALPALLLPRLASPDHAAWLGLACGVAAIAGHAKPVFLLGRGGGKGVATSAGVFLALAPWAFVIAFAAFGVTFAAARIVSLASLAAAVAMPVGVALTVGVRTPLLGASIVVSGFVIWAHRANIARLRAGTEPRFGSRPTPEAR
jgi:acyl phosphate:glycerol-3-phosphate acyltransferase